jgi:hypothetical protein
MSVNDNNFSALGARTKKRINIRLLDEKGAAWPLVYHVVNIRHQDQIGRSESSGLVRDGTSGNGMVACATDEAQEKHGR